MRATSRSGLQRFWLCLHRRVPVILETNRNSRGYLRSGTGKELSEGVWVILQNSAFASTQIKMGSPILVPINDFDPHGWNYSSEKLIVRRKPVALRKAPLL